MNLDFFPENTLCDGPKKPGLGLNYPLSSWILNIAIKSSSIAIKSCSNMSSVKKSDDFVTIVSHFRPIFQPYSEFSLFCQKSLFSKKFWNIIWVRVRRTRTRVWTIMRIYLFLCWLEILKAEVCLKNIRTIYKTTFPGKIMALWTVQGRKTYFPALVRP